jgi:hypothetical protein
MQTCDLETYASKSSTPILISPVREPDHVLTECNHTKTLGVFSEGWRAKSK